MRFQADNNNEEEFLSPNKFNDFYHADKKECTNSKKDRSVL